MREQELNVPHPRCPGPPNPVLHPTRLRWCYGERMNTTVRRHGNDFGILAIGWKKPMITIWEQFPIILRAVLILHYG
jgi:hypothetical protein